jgi:hypothetical protein
LMADAHPFGDDPARRRVVGLDCGSGLHVGDLPERGPPRTATGRSIGDCSVCGAGTKLSVRSPLGGVPTVLCAKSLRRSGEISLHNQATPFWSLPPALRSPAGRRPCAWR